MTQHITPRALRVGARFPSALPVARPLHRVRVLRTLALVLFIFSCINCNYKMLHFLYLLRNGVNIISLCFSPQNNVGMRFISLEEKLRFPDIRKSSGHPAARGRVSGDKTAAKRRIFWLQKALNPKP